MLTVTKGTSFHYKGCLITAQYNYSKKLWEYTAYASGFTCPNLQSFSMAKGWIDFIKG